MNLDALPAGSRLAGIAFCYSTGCPCPARLPVGFPPNFVISSAFIVKLWRWSVEHFIDIITFYLSIPSCYLCYERHI